MANYLKFLIIIDYVEMFEGNNNQRSILSEYIVHLEVLKHNNYLRLS